jgi:cytochrome b561
MGSRDPMTVTSIAAVRGASARLAERYTWQAMALHWLIAALVIGMLWLGWSLEDIPRNTPARGFYVNLHKSFGVLALILVFLRLAWRIGHRPPPFPSGMAAWQTKVASITHWLLYACILIQPLSGYLASSFSKFGVKFFGIPVSPWGWDDKALRDFFGEIHGLNATLLAVLVAVHVLAAFKHLLLDRDTVFQRMLPGRARRG